MEIKNLKQKIIDCAIAGVLVLVLYILKIPCLFKVILGISCPGCGLTRACISVLHLDFQKAFEMNPMFWAIPIVVLWYFKDGKIFKQKWLNITLTVLLFGGFFAQWIIRLILGTMV